MEETKVQKEKLTYEELENVAHQISEQNRQLYQQLKQMDMSNIFKRLDYLFKVVENSPSFDIDFVEKCTSEIQDIMTVTEENKEEE